MADTGKKEANTPKIVAPTVELPKGGGSLKGMGDSFNPDFFTGTGSYSIALPIPSARGLEPPISLDYGSGSGNGVFGMGFSLSLSKISLETNKHIPRYDGRDKYILAEGGELVQAIMDGYPKSVNGVKGETYTVTRYLPRIQTLFSKIEHWYSNISGYSWWKIVSADNITSFYGRTSLSRIADPSDDTRIFEWLIDETIDAKGNRILYDYKAENEESIPVTAYEVNRMFTANRYLQRVRYGNYFDRAKTERFAFELIFNYGEYDLSDPAKVYTPSGRWSYRADPFSFYNSGFEIRTCRLCQSVLLFHHFTDEFTEPLLTTTLMLEYTSRQPIGKASLQGPSLLTSATTTGYKKNNDGTVTNKSMPRLELTYSGFNPDLSPAFGKLDMAGHSIAGNLDDSQFLPVDLYGEGLPGFIYANNKTVFYLEPEGYGHYSMPQYPYSFPIYKDLQTSAIISLGDIDGDGKLELIVGDSSKSGYYEYREDGAWHNFRNFDSYPVDLSNPQTETADLNANGKADLMLPDEDSLLVYFSEGKKGYKAATRVPNENGFPLVKQDYESELVTFANIFGDGLPHRVKVVSGSVECWPCLGYGRYGKKISIGNAPVFGDNFDRRRLFFADLDGSGPSDIIYVHPHKVEVFLNQNGNSFSEPICIDLPDTFGQLDRVTFADILGNGTACLVFSKMTPSPVHYYHNFAGEIKLSDGQYIPALKPYLLSAIENNIGTVTSISYASSTKFYLEDKKRGRPWITKLPIPVQVIEQISVTDRITGSVFVNKFKYHDGYYDPVERTFCGFGFVESWDTETYEEYLLHTTHNGAAANRLDKELFVPPVYTRMWFNTGSFKSNPALSDEFRKNYFDKDGNAYDLLPAVFQPVILESGDETIRQACFALKGQLIRQEVYANDESQLSSLPYTVNDSNVEVLLIQDIQPDQYAVLMVNDREKITYNYERNADDPVVQQGFVLETDLHCGLPISTCSVFLPRRNLPVDTTAIVYPEQKELKSVAATNLYINTEGEETGYWRGIPCEQKEFQLFNLDIKGKPYFSYNEIKRQVTEALQKITPYQAAVSAGRLEARQLTWTRQYFWNKTQKKCTDYLPLLGITAQGLLHHEENASFTKEWIKQSIGDKLSEEIISVGGGYQFDKATGYWWNKGLVQFYLDAGDFYMPSVTELCFAPANTSVFSKTTVEYDTPYCLFPVKSTRYPGKDITLIEKFTMDYQALGIKQVVDANEVVSQVLFDPLGIVVAATRFGWQNGKEMGGMRIYEYQGKPVEFKYHTQTKSGQPLNFDDVKNNPEYYLQGATQYFFYTLQAWTEGLAHGTLQPSSIITLSRQNYFHDAEAPTGFSCQVLIAYIDSLGRPIEKKQFAGVAKGGSAKRYGTTFEKRRVTNETTAELWLTSGRIIYNNKGNATAEYLPFYDNAPYFESQLEPALSKAVPPPAITHYDPLGRVIRVDSPKGFFTKVEISSWEEKVYDEDDTVLDSPYYIRFMKDYPKHPDKPNRQQIDEKDALDKAAKFYNTPVILVGDNMNFTIRTIQTFPNRSIVSKQVNDIQGRLTGSIDPRLNTANETTGTDYANFRYRYMMNDADPFFTDSADAGLQYHFKDIFGNQLWSYSARNYCQVIIYDGLQRKIKLLVKEMNTSVPPVPLTDFNLLEHYIYTETLPDHGKYKKYNLLGQVQTLYDLSGVVINKGFSLQGTLLNGSRQLVNDYKKPVNWNGPTLPQLGEVYRFSYIYDAINLLLSETTPDGSITDYTYNQLGLPDKTTITFKDKTIQAVINYIDYDANLQRTAIGYGNGIVARYAYENTTRRLLRLESTRPGSHRNRGNAEAVVQKISYTYDPMGNLTRMWDESAETVFYKNQKVVPLSDYTYDALYRLITAIGRQHPGINGGAYRNNKADNSFKQSLFTALPCVNDSCKLEKYTESYTYDDSGNLIKKQHTAASLSYTTLTPTHKNNNWLTEIKTTQEPAARMEYDASGNQQNLFINDSVSLRFNCCENLVKAGIITRPQQDDDAEYYVYDNSESRTRKVTERWTQGGAITEIVEKIYIGNYEIKRNKKVDSSGTTTTTLERQTLRVMDNDDCVLIAHYWVNDSLKREVDKAGERSLRFQMGNNLGSVAVEMDAQAKLISYEEYFPYAGTAIIAGDNEQEVGLKDYRYSGKECDDSTGLYYFGARYYVSWAGRWLNPDPAGAVDGLNLYAFAGNNPVNFVDSNGMMKRLREWEDSDLDEDVSDPDYEGNVMDVATQMDLEGSSRARGRQSYYATMTTNPMTANAKINYVTKTGKVYALLKVNGSEVQMGMNGKAGDKLKFYDIGVVNRRGPKDNFHAEDWLTSSFRQSVDKSKTTLPDFLTEIGVSDTAVNTGENVNGKQVFSLRINYSPCRGCVETIVKFQEYLTGELGKGNFIFRVKFLRPYEVSRTSTDPDAQVAVSFREGMRRLMDSGIYVRLQTRESAQKMAPKSKLPDSFGTEVIANLYPDLNTQLSKKWKALGVNRK